MKSKWFFIAVLFPVLSFSQDKSNGSGLNTIISGGVIAGESIAKPLFQVTEGIHYSRHFGGVGVGLDHYFLKSIPVFADWRMNFGKARLVFVYANGGYNFPYNNKSLNDGFGKTTDIFRGGLYMDAGLGYRIRLNDFHRLLLSAGYSQKSVFNKVGYTYACFNPPCEEVVYTYHYNLGRIITKLSWEFGK